MMVCVSGMQPPRFGTPCDPNVYFPLFLFSSLCSCGIEIEDFPRGFCENRQRLVSNCAGNLFFCWNMAERPNHFNQNPLNIWVNNVLSGDIVP